MQNLAKKAYLAGGSDFTMDIAIGHKATLEVLGYALRLTKAGKVQFPNLPQSNLSEADINTVRTVCTATDKTFSGKGGMVYQVTAYKNAKDNNEFVNTFNPNCEAGELIDVEAYQRKDAKGELATYTSQDGTVYPSVSIRLEVKVEEAETAEINASLEQEQPA